MSTHVTTIMNLATFSKIFSWLSIVSSMLSGFFWIRTTTFIKDNEMFTLEQIMGKSLSKREIYGHVDEVVPSIPFEMSDDELKKCEENYRQYVIKFGNIKGIIATAMGDIIINNMNRRAAVTTAAAVLLQAASNLLSR